MFRRTGLLIFVALVIAASTTPVAAQEYTNPFDWCIAVEHFPDEPIGDAPSKVGIYATFPLEYSGGIFEFGLSGASGDVTGSGPIDGFGIAHAYAPLFSYGTHFIISGYVRLDGMESPIDPAVSFFGVFNLFPCLIHLRSQ